MSEEVKMKIVGLKTRKELPERMLGEDPKKTIAVHLTYRRVIGHRKDDNGKIVPNYGGTMAHYPREKNFYLDTETLLPELD